MDPTATLRRLLEGASNQAELFSAYNRWRAGGGFAVTALLPGSRAYTLGAGGTETRAVTVDRLYRGHRGIRARVERFGGQGFRLVYLRELTIP